jgi:transcriptional regulator with XRE-family HTH domain
MIDPKVFKSCRLRLEMTQAELATALGYSRITINMWENGKARKGIPDHIAEKLLALGKAKVIKVATKLDQVVQAQAAPKPLALDEHWETEEEET